MVGKRFTDDELRQIEAMLKEDLPVREIARKLGRSSASVKNKCYRQRRDAMRTLQHQEQSHAPSTLHVFPSCGREHPDAKHVAVSCPNTKHISVSSPSVKHVLVS